MVTRAPSIFLEETNVDHAGDRIGPVNRRGAVAQDVDLLDRRQRERVQSTKAVMPFCAKG